MTWFTETFALPWALLGLPLLLLLPRGRGRWWRLATLAALILALAQPQRPMAAERHALLIDVSRSVGDGGRVAAQALAAALPADTSVYLYASDATRVDDPRSPAPSALDLSRTDLGRAMAVAVADGAYRLTVVSDGIDTVTVPSGSGPGPVLSSSVPVDVLPLGSVANARLEALLAPDRVSPGGTVEVVAVVQLDRPARLRLHTDLNGQPLGSSDHQLGAGTHALSFDLVAPTEESAGDGVLRVGAGIEVDFDQPGSDDRQLTEVLLAPRAQVLVIGDPAMAQLLRSQGFEVEEGGPERVAAPFDPGAVVLRAGAVSFTPGQLELLASYVDQGGGLLMTGGPDSFGLGGWYRTPVEAVLPVSSDVRTEVSQPQVAMVFVLDVSQSMATGNPSRLELAKRGAIEVVDLAYQDDLLGMVVFSDADSTGWVFELRPATEAGKRAMLGTILDIQTRGGTVLAPAYAMAVEALAATEAAIKHIIVLSDGKLADGQGPFSSGGAPDWAALAAGARLARITTSTIAIGQDADISALAALAAGGGGRFYEAFDVATLPRLFSNEALTAARDLLRDVPVQPQARRHALSPFDGTAPTLGAYVATSLKAGSEALFLAHDGEPVLAVGRAGLGRSAALTTDLSAWAADFGRWEELPGILGGLVRWLQARPAPYSASVEVRGPTLLVVVDAVTAGSYVNDRPLVARFQGAETPLRQVAPGRYQGELPVSGSGGTLVVSDGSEVVARRALSTPDPELAGRGGQDALRQLAERSGGMVISDPSEYAPPSSSAPTPLWGYPALLALLLFVAELATRRYGGVVGVRGQRRPI